MLELTSGLKFILVLIFSFFFLLVGCSSKKNESSVLDEKAGKKMQINSMANIDSGYHSSVEDWVAFLNCWRGGVEERLKKNAKKLPDDLNRVLLPGTTEYENSSAALLQYEMSTGTKFPKSFRDFFSVTSGNWLVENEGFLENDVLRSNFTSINKLGKFGDVDKLNWGAWKDAISGVVLKKTPPELYYRYGYFEKPSDRQDDSQFRWEHLNNVIKVGELRQGRVILLNPREVTLDAEWEAWTLSFKFGAMRFRSFAELMQYVAYEDIFETGGVFLPADKLRTTCAQHLKTAATD